MEIGLEREAIEVVVRIYILVVECMSEGYIRRR